eukprot:833384-Amphidinium_carterae.1
MDCFLRHGYRQYSPMNRPWFTRLELELSGLMAHAGPGRHSSDPQHSRQSVYRAEFLAVVRALEECQSHAVVSDCKGVVKAVQALQTGRRQPKGRNRDLEQRALSELLPGQCFRWIKAQLKQADVDNGRIAADDLQGNQQADVLANQGTAQHGPLEPDANSTGLTLRT